MLTNPPRLRLKAIKAAEAVGVEIAGVDLISVEDEPYAIEVNASTGFRGLLDSTGIDAAEKIAQYPLAKAKHYTRKTLHNIHWMKPLQGICLLAMTTVTNTMLK